MTAAPTVGGRRLLDSTSTRHMAGDVSAAYLVPPDDGAILSGIGTHIVVMRGVRLHKMRNGEVTAD